MKIKEFKDIINKTVAELEFSISRLESEIEQRSNQGEVIENSLSYVDTKSIEDLQNELTLKQAKIEKMKRVHNTVVQVEASRANALNELKQKQADIRYEQRILQADMQGTQDPAELDDYNRQYQETEKEFDDLQDKIYELEEIDPSNLMKNVRQNLTNNVNKNVDVNSNVSNVNNVNNINNVNNNVAARQDIQNRILLAEDEKRDLEARMQGEANNEELLKNYYEVENELADLKEEQAKLNNPDLNEIKDEVKVESNIDSKLEDVKNKILLLKDEKRDLEARMQGEPNNDDLLKAYYEVENELADLQEEENKLKVEKEKAEKEPKEISEAKGLEISEEDYADLLEVLEFANDPKVSNFMKNIEELNKQIEEAEKNKDVKTLNALKIQRDRLYEEHDILEKLLKDKEKQIEKVEQKVEEKVEEKSNDDELDLSLDDLEEEKTKKETALVKSGLQLFSEQLNKIDFTINSGTLSSEKIAPYVAAGGAAGMLFLTVVGAGLVPVIGAGVAAAGLYGVANFATGSYSARKKLKEQFRAMPKEDFEKMKDFLSEEMIEKLEPNQIILDSIYQVSKERAKEANEEFDKEANARFTRTAIEKICGIEMRSGDVNEIIPALNILSDVNAKLEKAKAENRQDEVEIYSAEMEELLKGLEEGKLDIPAKFSDVIEKQENERAKEEIIINDRIRGEKLQELSIASDGISKASRKIADPKNEVIRFMNSPEYMKARDKAMTTGDVSELKKLSEKFAGTNMDAYMQDQIASLNKINPEKTEEVLKREPNQISEMVTEESLKSIEKNRLSVKNLAENMLKNPNGSEIEITDVDKTNRLADFALFADLVAVYTHSEYAKENGLKDVDRKVVNNIMKLGERFNKDAQMNLAMQSDEYAQILLNSAKGLMEERKIYSNDKDAVDVVNEVVASNTKDQIKAEIRKEEEANIKKALEEEEYNR